MSTTEEATETPRVTLADGYLKAEEWGEEALIAHLMGCQDAAQKCSAVAAMCCTALCALHMADEDYAHAIRIGVCGFLWTRAAKMAKVFTRAELRRLERMVCLWRLLGAKVHWPSPEEALRETGRAAHAWAAAQDQGEEGADITGPEGPSVSAPASALNGPEGPDDA